MDKAARSSSVEERMGSPGLLQERRSVCVRHASTVIFEGKTTPETTSETKYGSLESIAGPQQVKRPTSHSCISRTGRLRVISSYQRPLWLRRTGLDARVFLRGRKRQLRQTRRETAVLYWRRWTRARIPNCLLNQKSLVFHGFTGSSNSKSNCCKASGTSLCSSHIEIWEAQQQSVNAANINSDRFDKMYVFTNASSRSRTKDNIVLFQGGSIFSQPPSRLELMSIRTVDVLAVAYYGGVHTNAVTSRDVCSCYMKSTHWRYARHR
jgi:hypothetical protein